MWCCFPLGENNANIMGRTFPTQPPVGLMLSRVIVWCEEDLGGSQYPAWPPEGKSHWRSRREWNVEPRNTHFGEKNGACAWGKRWLNVLLRITSHDVRRYILHATLVGVPSGEWAKPPAAYMFAPRQSLVSSIILLLPIRVEHCYLMWNTITINKLKMKNNKANYPLRHCRW